MKFVLSDRWWALVKWIGGEDDKKMTSGIDIRHIKDFDVNNFLDENHDPKTVYVIEWRDTVKEPLGGWKCYNAIIVDISHSIPALEKKLEALEGIKSPGPSPKPELLLISTSHEDDIQVLHEEEEVEIINNNTLEPENRENDENARKKLRFSLDSDADKKEDTTSTLNLTGAKSSVSQQLGGFQNPSTSSEAPQFITKEDLEKALAKMKQYYQVPQEAGVSSSKTKKFKTKEKKVELRYEGSNVFITDDQWRDAKRKNSFTSMATSLLVSTFSPEILLISNYKGSKSKNTDEKAQKYQALDPKVVNAIKEYM
ncbi:Protein of unknown function [Cotesia congregata]|uniref:BEN domain-containing protein n=1 Tax=Cotesia congregata TaxID=51543 RepID=A0A8J2H8P2_COTCN|nr:Protein of unknown function [Cotesia congregata]